MKQRELKFRAMRDDMNPSWVYGSLLYGGDIPRIQELPLFSLFTTCLKGTEGQFTGLQDRQGKDIYEWDLCDDGAGNIAIIEWAEDEVGFLWTHEAESQTPGSWCEVIGNIYENPELLK